MNCSCGRPARYVHNGQLRCGHHQLVLTAHSHGWMAGCHCGVAFTMPPGLYDTAAETAALALMADHLQGEDQPSR